MLISVAAGVVIFGSLVLLATSFAKSLPEVIHQNFADVDAAKEFSTTGAGTWQISGGGYKLAVESKYAKAGTNVALSVNQQTVSADEWRLETLATVTTTAASQADFSVVFDYTDDANYSYAHFSSDTNQNGVYTVDNGAQKKVASLATSISTSKTYEAELRKKGTEVKVYLNEKGGQKTYIDKADVGVPASMKVGYGSQGSSVTFDDLVVSAGGAVKNPTPTPTPEPTLEPTPEPAPTSTAEPTPTPTPDGGRAVKVTNSDQLVAALVNAKPGDVITLADGTYTTKGIQSPVAIGSKKYVGTFVASTSGTADKPIVLQGSHKAIIDGKPGGNGTGTQYGLYLAAANYWQVKGITVTNVAKGIVLDRSSHDLIDGVEVYNIGQEGIHLRSFSSDNVVQNSNVHDTGKKNPTYGEGLYVGSANSNWGTYSDGQPDRSDRNKLLNNTISKTGAESMDIKEGTTGGTIQGNSFDGAGMSGSWADSWMDMKGNNWSVTGNRGVNALQDGFQVHGALSGWGNSNTFTSNTADVKAKGYGFWLQNNVTGNIVSCVNTVTNAASGLSNVPCKQ
ncbi:right-handed parallel beta-helix repeat-containing protein [Candidatus Protofrankia californiensis]|uniref:right-handed parallel beta-helix repeat-containing protein n=1 Tax=Candidatus Protofrankia californiensis TaxID=1839754 RepID=UPI001041B37D|nr:right-handed parallel beta-helix repeat-containing protein [Candidatus Protofrankia californiensis]